MAQSTPGRDVSKDLTLVPRTCRLCGTLFTSSSWRQVFCAPTCRVAWSNSQKSPYGQERKRCFSCRQVKDRWKDFPISERLCNSCLDLRAVGQKACNSCGQAKEFNAYHRGHDRHGLDAVCKTCSSTRAQKHNAQEHVRDRHRDRKLAARYGLTLADYERMLGEQDNRCRVCPRKHKEHGRLLVVDHCHATGKVRGLLCRLCNAAIGCFEEDPIRMANAIAYLGGRE